MANVIGPDVSFYEDDPETPQGIDYVKMSKSAGYVIVRAGQNLWVDSDFKVNWRESKLAGLPRGSYWFYDSRAEPKRQAELWVQQHGADFGELPLFADLEESYMGPYRGWKNWYTFLERVKQLVNGKEISIYTAYYYWRDNAPNAITQTASLEYFHQYPLWIAHYGAVEPLIPLPWKKGEWLFWQYTEAGDGTLYGTESKGVDLNYFNGDMDAFRARFNLTDTPPPPNPEPDPGDTPTGVMYRVTAIPSLKVREGPGVVYNAIGLLYTNETVEEINANSDRSWLKVRKADGSLIGWSSSAYLENISGTPPPVEKRTYRVTASPSLKVRVGPGLSYASIGSNPYNSIVEEVDANVDRSWLKVKNSNASLIGWSLAQYLEYTGTTPLPPPVDKELYRVIRTSTQVLEEPIATAKVVGTLYFGEVVELIDTSADGLWLNVRKTDGSLAGWSLSKDLISSDAPPPPMPEEPPTPVPDDDDKKWYLVIVASLTVRGAPNITGKVLGTLIQDDTLPALDDTSTPGWTLIRRVDGLTGWCENKGLKFISNTRPASIRQNLFKGVTFLQKDLIVPRKNRMYVMAIDLTTVGLEFLVTPGNNTNGILCTRTTSKFLEEFSMYVAINGDGFNYLPASVDPATTCPNGGEPVKVNGYAASRGNVYSPTKTIQPTVYLSVRNQVTINDAPSKIFNAVSGDRIVVEKGVVVKNLAAQTPSPRTAIGLNRNGRWLILMVVDGRQPGYSEGVTFPELADLLISYGAFTGVNMDGGGSSTMIIKGVEGDARILNSPIDQNVPGKEREVANHLGLYIKK
jgi:GH25 family lysozyme M1 (1,4-beta-N-acetylmuramidase)